MEKKSKDLTALGASITKLTESFKLEHELNILRGNKAAGKRARKALLDLSKMIRDYRRLSVQVNKSDS